MTSPAALRVLVLALDNVGMLEEALEALSCEVYVAADVFEAMAEVAADPPDAVVLDLTMVRDDAHLMAEWLRDQDTAVRVVAIAEPVAGAADLGLDDLADEIVTTPPSRESLGRALGLTPPNEASRPKLTVKVNADLLDAHEVDAPPQRRTGGAAGRRALIVGLGAHAEAPRYDE